ncbi:12183_t:CDS:2 [Rhizophagus irregularis]|nr:12183_t:CDS:2 [Rhizophagus irregularis]
MGQAQDKLKSNQLEDNLQASSTIEENSVVTESTFTLVASDSNVHHNFSFSSPSIQDSHSQDNFTIRLTSSKTVDFTNNSLASSLAGLTIHDNSNSDNKPAASISEDISSKNIGSNSTDLINKKSKEIKSTLADEAEYTIPPAIAEDVLREMLANKPSQDLLEELEPPSVNTNGKGDNSSSKFKGDSVNHEKIGEFSEPTKISVNKNNLLILSGTSDSPFPSKFTFPNIADKNFFVPNFSNPIVTTTTSPSFSFGNPSELSLQNPFQSPSISSSNISTANTLQQKEQQRRVTLQWHPPVLDKFSPVLSSKTPSITMPSSSIWPPSINTTSPTDTQFSNSNLLFPQFTVPISPPSSTTISNTPPILSSTASTSRKGMHSNMGTGRTTTLYVSAKPSIKTVSNTTSNNGNMQAPLLVSPTSTIKKLPMKFGDISISSTALTSATASAKGITISVNNSNSNSNSPSTIQTSPPPRGFIHNATNAPTQRQIKELPRRAKFRFNIKNEMVVTQPSLPKRKALQTVGGGSTTSGGVGGVMKTLSAKERANPLRRVERRSTQRNNIKSSSNCDSILPFDSKSVNKELDGMRPPQTTFDFSFKSISEKSAAATAASVNAASAKRLAAVSPIQTMNAKNDPFSSSLFLQQSQSTVTTVVVPNNSKKKVSTKRAAPSSALFKTEDVTAVNTNHVHPQFAKSLKSLPPPPPLTTTPKRLPRKKNKKKAQAAVNNNDTSSTSGSVDIQPVTNNNSRRKIKFPEKSGDWICMFCEYKLYYGDGRRSRRRPKNNTNANNGDGGGGFNTSGDGGIAPDKALTT